MLLFCFIFVAGFCAAIKLIACWTCSRLLHGGQLLERANELVHLPITPLASDRAIENSGAIRTVLKALADIAFKFATGCAAAGWGLWFGHPGRILL